MKKIIEVSYQGNSEAVLSDLLYEFKDNLSAYNMTLKEFPPPTEDLNAAIQTLTSNRPAHSPFLHSKVIKFLNQLKGGEE